MKMCQVSLYLPFNFFFYRILKNSMTIYPKIFRSNSTGMQQWSQPPPLPVWSQKRHQCLKMRLSIKTAWCCSKKYRMYKLFLYEAYSALSLRSDSDIYYFLTQYILTEFLQCYNVPGMVLELRGHLSRPLFSKNFHISQGRQTIKRKQTLKCDFFSERDVIHTHTHTHAHGCNRVVPGIGGSGRD